LLANEQKNTPDKGGLDLHIEYFKEFVMLAECLNYSLAAEQLYITQPVLSRHIKSLEEHIGVQLFNRSTQAVKLTEPGVLLYENISAVLERYDEVISLVSKQGGNDVQVTLGIPYYAVKDYLQKVPAYITKNWPNMQLHYLTDDPNTVIFNLLCDKVDAIIIPHIPFYGADSLQFYDLFEEQMGIICNKSDPFASKSSVKISEIVDRDTLCVSTNYFITMWEQITDLCKKQGYKIKEPQLLNQMEAILIDIEISNSNKITFVGQHMKNLTQYDFSFVPLTNEYKRQISFCYQKKSRNPSLALVRDAFIHNFR